MTCKIRFVCVSDTHNASPANGAFKLPKGDVLIHAGDLTNQGTYAEIRKTLDWIQAADFGAKIVIAGNHDVTLDRRFYAEHGLKFHNKHPQNSQACIDLFNEYPSIKYLNHESVEICLSQDKAPRVQFKVFGSPYSPVNGLWAFGYTPEEASGLWDQIPFDVDIVVTHTPPRYHCDGSRLHRAVGCEALHKKLRQVRPQLVVCGHIHEGRGAERVLWDYPSLSANNGESSVRYWIDPGHDNKKQSLLDLFAKGGLPLENNQSPETANAEVKFGNQPKTTNSTSPKSWSYADSMDGSQLSESLFPLQGNYDSTKAGAVLSKDSAFPAFEKDDVLPSTHFENEAFLHKMTRQETCIINAAIMASSWPHKSNGGKSYNKPIVVDIDLPTYEDKAVE